MVCSGYWEKDTQQIKSCKSWWWCRKLRWCIEHLKLSAFRRLNWKWHTVYTELWFSFTAGLVFNMSIHWAQGLWLHTCIRSPWFNCAFVGILPSRVYCYYLLAAFFLTSQFVWSRFGKVSYCAILCGRTERGAAAASKMALVHYSFCHKDLYFHLLMMALILNAVLAYFNQNHTGKTRRSGHFVK